MPLEFRCADVGVECSARTTAATTDELLAKVSAHAEDAHGVTLDETLIDYALTKVHGQAADQ